MRSFLIYIICTIVLFSSCNWVNDDLSECPSGTWLKISFTYNIMDVEAASSQVGDITIFAFDENDIYLDKLDVDSITLHQGYCMVRVPFSEKTRHLLIWGGITGHSYQYSNLQAGETDRKSLLLSLVCDSENQQNGKLKALFHSSLENVKIGPEYQVITSNLVKNSNYFSCILQDETNNTLNQEDFDFIIESANGLMDYTNTPFGNPVYYHPYRKESVMLSEQIPVVHARLATLRLMKGDQTTLTIKHIPSGKDILRIPITQYLLLSKIYTHLGEIGDQEYLDRQDSYTLLFFIKTLNMDVPKISPQMKINDWVIRINDSELDF